MREFQRIWETVEYSFLFSVFGAPYRVLLYWTKSSLRGCNPLGFDLFSVFSFQCTVPGGLRVRRGEEKKNQLIPRRIKISVRMMWEHTYDSRGDSRIRSYRSGIDPPCCGSYVRTFVACDNDESGGIRYWTADIPPGRGSVDLGPRDQIILISGA